MAVTFTCVNTDPPHGEHTFDYHLPVAECERYRMMSGTQRNTDIPNMNIVCETCFTRQAVNYNPEADPENNP